MRFLRNRFMIVLAGAFLFGLGLIGLGLRDTYLSTMERVVIEDEGAGERELHLAILGDIHVSAEEAVLDRLSAVVEEVIAAKPDIILLVGDYTIAAATAVRGGEAGRKAIAARLGGLTKAGPVFAVLGNHDVWDSAEAWDSVLTGAGITMMDNRVALIDVAGTQICLRGLGDVYSRQYRPTTFPPGCAELRKLSMTHDPMAAFMEAAYPGLMVAGHTHCGQLRVPLLGAFWVPTRAPAAAHCGLYQDEGRLLWVTAGLGASLIPVRVGTRSAWDLITLR